MTVLVGTEFAPVEPFVDAAARTAAAAWPSTQRQERVKSFLVRYPIFNRAVDDVRSFHRPVADGVPDHGCICGLLGESRAGKSTAIKHYIRDLGLVDREKARVPKAIYIDAKKGMNSNMLAEGLYAQLGLRRRSRGGAGQHLTIITDEFVEHGIELVVIDDAQWLLGSPLSRTVGDVMGFIVDTAERNTCNVVLCGLPEIEDAIHMDAHAVGRGGFPHAFVDSFDWYDVKGRVAFRRLLSLIGSYLPFRDLPPFADEFLSAHFYKVSGGLIGRVLNYVRIASLHAIDKGSPTLEVEHLIYAGYRLRRTNDTFVPFQSFLDINEPGGIVDNVEDEALAENEAGLRARLTKNRKPRRGRIATIGSAAARG